MKEEEGYSSVHQNRGKDMTWITNGKNANSYYRAFPSIRG